MHIRCPHCQQAVEFVRDQDIAEVACPSCGSSFDLLTETTSFFLSKRSIGHFELLDQLGTGGFGTVWKARDTKLDRLVAIKVPRVDHSDPQHAELFLREARAAAQLRHPQIVAVHEVGRDDGTLYIVSDFIEGVTLADRLTAGPFTPHEAAELLAQVADALHHAHEAGVIHRDFKPSNIMLDEDGQPRLMDFGLAKRDAGEITMTIDGKVLGTPAYMSPEQARGEGHQVDRRTDVYSLGVILFELLTGERPFRGNTRMLLHQVIHDDPPSPRKLNSRVPRNLETICLKAMAKETVQRFSTAQHMADDLHRFVRGEPIHARSVTQAEKAWRWCRRNPVIASLTGAVLLTTLLGIGGISWALVEAQRATTRALTNEGRALNEWKRAELAADGERRQAAAATTSAQIATAARHEAELTLADMHTSFGLFTEHKAIAALWFAHAAAASKSDAARRDANLVRFQSWTRRAARPYRILAHSGPVAELLFHPSGCYLLAQTTSGFVLWDLALERQVPWPEPGQRITAALWSPDGGLLATGTATGQVSVIAFPECRSIAQLSQVGPITSLAFSADGTLLAMGTKIVRVWNVTSRELLKGESAHPSAVVGISFDPQAARFVTSCLDDQARIFEITAGEVAATPAIGPLKHSVHTQFLQSSAFAAQFLSDSTLLLKNDTSIRWLNAAGTQAIATLTIPSSYITTLKANTERDLFILCGNPHSQVWDVRTRRPASPVLRHETASPGGVLLPDRRPITVCTDRIARLWSSSASPDQPEHLFHGAELVRIAAAPSGKLVATAQSNGTVTIWALPPASLHDQTLTVDPTEMELRLSRDKQYWVTSGGSAGNDPVRKVCACSRVIDAATLRQVGALLTGPFHGIDMAPDNTVVATAAAGKNEVVFWDWKAGTPVGSPVTTPREPVDVAFSLDGRWLIVACVNGEVLVIEREGGQIVRRMRHGAAARTSWTCPRERWIVVSPRGDRFATLGFGTVARLWEMSTGRLVGSVQHKEVVTRVAFSPTGEFLATASRDDLAVVVNAGDGKQLASLRHPDCVFDVRFSTDEDRLFTACRDHQGRCWNWRAESLAQAPIDRTGEVGAIGENAYGVWTQTTYGERSMSLSDVWGRPLIPALDCHDSWVLPEIGVAVTRKDRELRRCSVESLGLSPEAVVPSAIAARIAEISAAQQIVKGAAVTLTDVEVRARWTDVRTRYPDLHDFDELATPITDAPISFDKYAAPKHNLPSESSR